jgi:hypothetical protein
MESMVDIEVNIKGNVNPQYILLNNDINLVKETVKNMNEFHILAACPVTTLVDDTLFYHAYKGQLSGTFGEQPDIDEQEFTNYTFTFPTNYKNDETRCQILYNDLQLKLLDVTQISVELGFNPLYYYINDVLNTIDDNIIFNYCKTHKLDGYINLNNIYDFENATNNLCAKFVRHDVQYPVCSNVFLINRNKYGPYKLKILGDINLVKKNKDYLPTDTLLKLHNVLFCNISNLIEITDQIKTTPVVDKGESGSFILSFDNYDFSKIYSNKNLLDILSIDYTDVSNQCEFDFYSNDQMEIPTELPSDLLTQPEIVLPYQLKSYKSNDLFKVVFQNIAETNHMEIAKLPNYENVINLIENAATFDEIKQIVTKLENHIIYDIHERCKLSKHGYKCNINFINLQYITTTYNYLKNKIMNYIEQGDVIDILTLYNKNVNKYFNVDTFFIDITYHKYNKPKLLYQDLLKDVTQYKASASIDVNFLKLILKINNLTLTNLHDLYLNIYNYYKAFLIGDILLGELHQFLQIDEIYNLFVYTAEQFNINTSLIIHYTDIINYKNMSNFDNKLNDIKNVTDLQLYMTQLKSYILMLKLTQSLAEYLNLNTGIDKVSQFLTINVEKFISVKLDEQGHYYQLMNNNQVNFYSFLTQFYDTTELYNFIVYNNNNSTMLPFIYNYLDIPLKNEEDILKLVRHKKLLDVYLEFLRNDINLSNLKKAIHVNLSVKNVTKRKKEDKE